MNEFTFFGKPIEELTEEELMAERDVQAWAAARMIDAAHNQSARLNWLIENEPYVDPEDIERMYEDGDITREERNELRKRARKRRYEHDKAERAIVFAQMLEAHFKAVKVKCSEQIEIIRGEKKHAVRGKKPRPRKPPRYDPRVGKVRKSWYAPVAPIIGYIRKWNRVSYNYKEFEKILKRTDPMQNWDYEKLQQIAFSRGYMSTVTLAAAVAQEMNITVSGAENMLKSGRLTWGYCLLIGAILEMTPAEFCDTFLSGYFKEVVDGKWIAELTDEEKKSLLYRPYMPQDINRTEEE